MISILIVDDQSDKVRLIRQVVEDAAKDVVVEVSEDASDAAARLEATAFDLLVVDLNIPMRGGQSPAPDGGINLLRNLKRKKSIMLPRHILGLTAHDELHSKYADEFERDLWHLIRFDRTTTDWVDRLRSKIIHIADAPVGNGGKFGMDLAIVTALHEVELESILALDGAWKPLRKAGDSTSYHAGIFRNGDVSLRVVAAASIEMGMPAAAALSMKMIAQFRPRLLAMCGIAAGVKGNFGDILIADRCWDYGSGKHKYSTKTRRSRFLPEPTQIPVSTGVKDAVSNFILNKSIVKSIYDNWPGAKPKKRIAARIGPFASGAAVVQNRRVIASIVQKNRKLIGVEMETYGVFMAAKVADAPSPEAISVKSICDFGSKSKSDEYQSFAGYTSAAFLREFALYYLKK